MWLKYKFNGEFFGVPWVRTFHLVSATLDRDCWSLGLLKWVTEVFHVGAKYELFRMG